MKYNPFKMWGSYVGAILFFIFARGFGSMSEVGGSNSLNIIENPDVLVIVIPVILIGFLLGWGIHSLFRRFKK